MTPKARLCKRGHECFVGIQCRQCVAIRKRYKKQPKAPARVLPPPAVSLAPRFVISREELIRERDASIARQRKRSDEVLARVRAQLHQEFPDSVPGSLPFDGGRRFKYRRTFCEVCGDPFYRLRKAGRPAKRCGECRREAA